MAKAYKAVTRIEHGQANSEGNNEVIVFEPGEIVKGLDADTMKGLWDAGALEEATVVSSVEVDEGKASSEEASGQDVIPIPVPGAGAEGTEPTKTVAAKSGEKSVAGDSA